MHHQKHHHARSLSPPNDCGACRARRAGKLRSKGYLAPTIAQVCRLEAATKAHASRLREQAVRGRQDVHIEHTYDLNGAKFGEEKGPHGFEHGKFTRW